MYKIRLFISIILLTIVQLHAITANDIVGSWYSSLRTVNNGTEIIEKESLKFNADNTFMLVILVNLNKDIAYVKDLRIEVIGNWEVKENALIYTINSVNVPSAKDIYQVSKQSLDNLASSFKSIWVSDKIHIYKIISFEPKKLTVKSRRGIITKYKRLY